MDRRDRSVGAVPLGFGCESEDDQAGDEPAERDEQRDPPRVRRPARSGVAFPERRRRVIAAEGREQSVRCPLQRRDEGDGAETCDDTDQRAEQNPFAQVTARDEEATP